ncbi:MAG: acetylglutamate kinase [Muribaculum sp.]|nr:acetylglutamate kinase [Muribaculum sp.]MDE6458350.1 acetylglutamate kinase [Muribaculum sp.]
MKDKLTIIKVGGKIVEEKESLDSLLRDFAAIEGFKLLVHGGGRSATKVAAQLGIETLMIDGRRVTDDAMLDVVTMVYGGLVNKKVVARLQSLGIDALGMTGADMNIIHSHKRPVKSVDYGWVGDVDSVNGEALSALLRSGVVPVVAPLTHDGEGHLLNTNADTMAGETAKGLAPFFDVSLVYCFEKPGVLRDENDDDSVIAEIDPALFASLKEEGIVTGGMLPKLENAFNALDHGVGEVVITRASSLDDLSLGTHIRK